MAQNEPQHKETPPGPSPNSPSVSGISVYKRQIYEIAESSRIESKLFCPNWNALLPHTRQSDSAPGPVLRSAVVGLRGIRKLIHRGVKPLLPPVESLYAYAFFAWPFLAIMYKRDVIHKTGTT